MPIIKGQHVVDTQKEFGEYKKKKKRDDFPDEGTEVQRSNGTCPRSVAELRPEPTFPDIPSGPFETELV